jgi:hypothetical protein
VKEVELASPVPYRWMYFLERYMKDLKGWIKNKARPEGSMAEGYILQEAMTHVTEFTSRLDPKVFQLWKLKEDPELFGMKLPKRHRLHKLERDSKGRIFLEQAHAFVLKNDPCMKQWQLRYSKQSSLNWSNFGEWVGREMRGMIDRREPVREGEYHLALDPHPKVKFYSHMWADG